MIGVIFTDRMTRVIPIVTEHEANEFHKRDNDNE